MKKKNIFCAFLLVTQFFLLKAQQKVGFKTSIKAAGKVSNVHLFLAGDFNNWNPADTAWELKPDPEHTYRLFKLLQNGNYSYKVTRGSWQSVECTATGKAIENRTLTVQKDTNITLSIAAWQDDFKIIAKEHTYSKQVHVVSEQFDIPQLGRKRRIWIYLPAGYQKTHRSYPVIYMHDGQNLFDAYTSGYGEWGIDELMDQLPDAKACIIVGIDHGGENRITEYDPYDSKYGKGRGDDYADFLVKTLKPYIDKHYHTLTAAKYTAIAGSSMGGLISMYTAFKYPGVFRTAGIFSPAFWIAPQVYQDADKANELYLSRFYFVCGDAESESMVADMDKMTAIIAAKKHKASNVKVTVVKGAGHNEKQWQGDFPAFYDWFLSGIGHPNTK